jgi:hypothetical protein
MAMTITPDHDTEFEPSGRRRKITKFALAGVAVLGVGAALTSAAWTDNVWFGGSASSGVVDLTGSTTGQANSFVSSDGIAGSDGVTLTIPNFVLAPNTDNTKRVWVRNEGDLPVSITLDPQAAGPLFDSLGATIDAVYNDADGVINPGQTVSIDVTVTGGDWTGTEGQGQVAGDNAITLQVEGTAGTALPAP